MMITKSKKSLDKITFFPNKEEKEKKREPSPKSKCKEMLNTTSELVKKVRIDKKKTSNTLFEIIKILILKNWYFC